MVARYFVDSNEAVLDWAGLLEKFEGTFELMGGPFASWNADGEVDYEVDEPYRYRMNQSAGNLAGSSLAESIREFVRALLRMGKYSNTGRSDRIDTDLLTRWAEAVHLAGGFELESEELVGIFLNVSEAHTHFAEDVACDVAIATIRNRPTNVSLEEIEQTSPTESARNMIETELAAESKSSNPRISLSAHMNNLLEKHKDACESWSVGRWQLQLTPTWGKTPSKGGIHGTAVWKWLMKLRGEREAALNEKQTAKDQAGKRRTNAF